jgi:hypothetical protein
MERLGLDAGHGLLGVRRLGQLHANAGEGQALAAGDLAGAVHLLQDVRQQDGLDGVQF